MSWALRRQCEVMLNQCIIRVLEIKSKSSFGLTSQRHSLSISAYGWENVSISPGALQIYIISPKLDTIYIPLGSQQDL